MHIRLKGLNRVRKKLADGRTVEYFYAWKGGPRLEGKPGSPEFIAAYNEAVRAKIPVDRTTLESILDAFQDSADFAKLGGRTQKDYRRHLKMIATEFGDFPLRALEMERDRAKSRAEFLNWRDVLARSSRRQADYVLATFARVFSWAKDRGLILANPLESRGRLYRSERSESVWTEEDQAAFNAVASKELRLALLLAVWTGQRQGDLLRLTWSAYDGRTIRFQQGKTRKRILIPVAAPLRAALETAKRQRGDAVTILKNSRGAPWTADGFRTSWGKACQKAKIAGLTFHDLRGTAVTRLALAECSEAEIATITGHSLKDVGAILDAHYLRRDQGLAESAMRKLESRTKNPTALPTAQGE
ncbi:MAG: tyrosine-type recombinase/integrase [Alphaproteobacteria bacterium]|nr:tyrosine-type recombinase/integrase [Alphaproteobacteria bacterium]